jgi:hypothetical protein
MATGAETIIEKILETAGDDERVGGVLRGLREAYARGEWNPTALAEVVEQATSAEMGESS